MLSKKLSKTMKTIIYAFILILPVTAILVFKNQESKNEIHKKSIPKPLTDAEKNAIMKKWEATPEGQDYNKWKESPTGKKVYADADKIRTSLKNFTDMEGVITSLTLPPGSRLGFGVMVQIDGEDYILAFGPEPSAKNNLPPQKDFKQLHNLKVNDKIIVRSHNVSFAPKYSYPIVAGDYVERDGKVIYKRVVRKGGC
jgi:hypothetical protein